MLVLAPGWECEVERGPDWLFLRLARVDDSNAAYLVPLAERVWEALGQHQTYRLVLELGELRLLHSYLIGQLLLLARRVHGAGGVLRISELSESNRQVLLMCRLEGLLPVYPNRWDAVRGALFS